MNNKILISSLYLFLIVSILGYTGSQKRIPEKVNLKLIFSDFELNDKVKFTLGDIKYQFIVSRYDSSGISKVLNESIYTDKYNYFLKINENNISQGEIDISKDTKILYISPHDIGQSSYEKILMD